MSNLIPEGSPLANLLKEQEESAKNAKINEMKRFSKEFPSKKETALKPAPQKAASNSVPPPRPPKGLNQTTKTVNIDTTASRQEQGVTFVASINEQQQTPQKPGGCCDIS